MENYWSFWCDEVQPAARKALGRDDVWGTGISLSPASVDTQNGIWQFIHAYEADYVTREGKLVINNSEIRQRLINRIPRMLVADGRILRLSGAASKHGRIGGSAERAPNRSFGACALGLGRVWSGLR